MKCNEIQNLILTDYMDNQLSTEIRKQVDKHLLQCDHCQEFASVVKEEIFTPFEKTIPVEPPNSIWDSIKEEINEDNVERQSVFNGIFEWFRSLNLLSQPIIQFTCVAVLLTSVIFGINSLRRPSVVKIINQKSSDTQLSNNQETDDNESYLVFLIDEVETNGRELNEYGTAIEEYFL